MASTRASTAVKSVEELSQSGLWVEGFWRERLRGEKIAEWEDGR